MVRKKTNEEFVKQVYDLVEKEYTFLEIYIDAKTKIKCRHNIKECGHEWSVKPSEFLKEKGTRCPKCFGRIKKTNEQFLEEVYELVGEEYAFLEKYKNTDTKILCKHNTDYCGYEWKITPSNFLKGRRCPKCAGVSKKTDREFKRDVYNLVGDEYTFLDEYRGANTDIECIHNKCSHKWEIRPSSFLQGNRCPKCISSRGEILIAKLLDKNDIDYIQEHRFDDCKNIKTGYTLPFDFYLPDYNLLIEYDGEQHYKPVKFGGMSIERANKSFLKTQKRDNIKNQYCEDNKIPLLRIPYWDFDIIEDILSKKLNDLEVKSA